MEYLSESLLDRLGRPVSFVSQEVVDVATKFNDKIQVNGNLQSYWTRRCDGNLQSYWTRGCDGNLQSYSRSFFPTFLNSGSH